MKQWKQMAMHACVLLGFFSGAAQADATVAQLITAEQAMFQDLKNYLGVTQAKTIEAQNLLLFMMPPYADVTKTVGTRMVPAETSLASWQESMLRQLAMYNVYTPEESIDGYLQKRLAFCGRNDKNKQINRCDYTQARMGDDVLAFSLLDKVAFQDEGARTAALEYIRNMTNPTPANYPKDPAKLFVKGDEKQGLTDEGKKYFQLVYQQMPALTLAQNSLLAIFADRDRVPDFGKGLPVGDTSTGAASMLEMMNYEVGRRYSNPDWYDAMNKASNASVAREVANMMAVEMYLNVKKYEQMSRIEALLAAQISLLAGLNSQMAGAKGAAQNINTEELTKGVTGG
ncbi:MAG: hypothetical protein ACHQAX_09255 [Gammaproteobacteria bacterium]